MRALWLPAVLRAAGLTVVEVEGWRSLGSGQWDPTGGIVHATADGAASNPVADSLDDAAAINVIRNGRPGLAGPIANAYHNRAGVWYVIASGRCNTALKGTAGPLKGLGNLNLLGIEHENDNRGERWPETQWRTALVGWAAICRQMHWRADRLAGHKEHDPGRKSDPLGIDMDAFRSQVQQHIAGGTRAGNEDNDMDWNQSQQLAAVFNRWEKVELDTDATPDGQGARQTFPVPLTAWTKGVDAKLAELAARPAPAVAMSPEDRAAIVADLRADLGGIVEQAVRTVFGGLDGATPTSG